MGTCCTTVEQSEIAVLERCGAFSAVAGPGFHCILPWTSRVGTLSMRLIEHCFIVRSKTKDNVFVNVKITMQYQVIPSRVYSVYYSLDKPLLIIQSYVENTVEARIPSYNLEALFIERGTLSQQLKDETDAVMTEYGWDIVSVLITEIDPGEAVTEAINSIQKFQRLRVAAVDEAETKKLMRVRAAEAECGSRRLAGEGLAEQRKAIVAGLRKSVEEMQHVVHGLSNDDVLKLLMLNQYYETLKSVAEHSGGSLLFVNGGGGVDSIVKEISRGVAKTMK